VGLSRSRCGNAAAGADRGHSRRDRQPPRRARRKLLDRVPLQFWPGDAARPRLRDPVPADAAGPGAAAPGIVRQIRVMSPITPRRAAIGIALLLLVTLPIWVGNPYYINVSSQILLYAVFALALNVLVGYGGLVSLGHAGLFATAGYAGALMLQAGYGHFVADGVAILVALLAAAVFGVLALRSTGLGFLMITL